MHVREICKIIILADRVAQNMQLLHLLLLLFCPWIVFTCGQLKLLNLLAQSQLYADLTYTGVRLHDLLLSLLCDVHRIPSKFNDGDGHRVRINTKLELWVWRLRLDYRIKISGDIETWT